QRSKMTQYCNIGSFSIVESREISLCQKPIFELTSVYDSHFTWERLTCGKQFVGLPSAVLESL
ncbi:MAG: hypothetical protein ACXWM7_04290, partial [Parachlamydiaceae bacterium]